MGGAHVPTTCKNRLADSRYLREGNVRQAIVWARLFGVSGAVWRRWSWTRGWARWWRRSGFGGGQRRRCGVCGRRCSFYDRGEGRRRWRALDLGTTMAFVEAEAPRVSCREHGVVVARVPWARHDSRFTKDFEEQCAWMAVHVSKTTLAELVRIAWRTVGRIISRVVEERSAEVDRLDGLSKIGIDEVSFRRGQRYLTVVVDHETARVVWVEEGRDEATLERFFDRLGPERAAALRFVDRRRRRMDQERARAAVSEGDGLPRSVPRRLVGDRRAGPGSAGGMERGATLRSDVLARELKGARYALWKNPEDLTRRQTTKLADIARMNKPLYRAYLLKEQLREVFRLPFRAAVALLDHWLEWARRCRLAPFVRSRARSAITESPSRPHCSTA